MGMQPGELVRSVRMERGLDQSQLARRAGTTQTHVSRIERGAVAPSTKTLERLLNAMGRRLVMATEPLPCGNASPSELRADLRDLTAAERLDRAIELSEFLTDVQASARRREPA